MKTLHFIIVACCMLLVAPSTLAQNKKAQKLFKKGQAAMEQYKYIQATVHFTNAITQYRSYSAAYYQRGLSFAAINQLEAAAEDYESAIEHDTEDPMVYLNLILVRKRNGDYEKALETGTLLGENMPELVGVGQYHNGVTAEEMENQTAAIEWYTKAMPNLDPEKNPHFQELLDLCKARLKELKP
ncbi:MAG: hypothetical protein AAF242_01155 [Bacteroidota bacterium]